MITFLKDNIYLRSADSLMILTKMNDNIFLSYIGDYYNFNDCDNVIPCNNMFAKLDALSNDNCIFSYVGDGNYDEQLLQLTDKIGNSTFRFTLNNTSIINFIDSKILPFARDKEDTLKITFKCVNADILVNIYISCFNDAGVFSFISEVVNNGDTITVNRLMSAQLSMYGESAKIATFDGAWARERRKNISKITNGIFTVDSKCGFSSNRHNPFVMTTVGDKVIATNLIWTGNHKEIIEINPMNKVSIMTGMNDYHFNYTLNCGESLYSPEAVVCVKNNEEQITDSMHNFVSNHIIPSRFVNFERPILFNNWEATYFDFNEEKILRLADTGASLGVELFVLDDGWFGARDDDFSSLGDWYDNVKKTGGLKNLKEKLKEKNLKFGLWFEPEMISPNSDLYRAHPEFAMQLPNLPPIQTRYQLMLDFANPDVCDYVVDTVGKIISEVGIDYVKWDCNRCITDAYSNKLENQGEYFYKYIVGLYDVIRRLTSINENVIFEGCASGGNRFDLGILCYMPQTWCSDNTDARDRCYIQEGTLYAYPQSTIGAHVSICPNLQSGNSTSIENRFNVVSLGAFGYEMDFNRCATDEIKTIKDQIEYYKQHRKLLQFGKYTRLGDIFNNTVSGWQIVSNDKSEGMAFIVSTSRPTNGSNVYRLQLRNFDDKAVYSVEFRSQTNCDKVETFRVSGAKLNNIPFDFGNIYIESDREQFSNSIATRLVYFKKI